MLSSCKEQTKEKLGVIQFEYTGDKSAIPHFATGLKLLHNFEYDDGAEAFQMAQKEDPDFVMAYWGEAMTYNHPLWRQQDQDKAREMIEKSGQMGVPVITVGEGNDEELIIGFDQNRLSEALGIAA